VGVVGDNDLDDPAHRLLDRRSDAALSFRIKSLIQFERFGGLGGVVDDGGLHDEGVVGLARVWTMRATVTRTVFATIPRIVFPTVPRRR
jgi:hypothetical protein